MILATWADVKMLEWKFYSIEFEGQYGKIPWEWRISIVTNSPTYLLKFEDSEKTWLDLPLGK